MKKGIIFILGMVAGAILTILVCYLTGTLSCTKEASEETYNPGVTMFEEPREQLNLRSFKLIQCFESGPALALGSQKNNVEMEDFIWGGQTVFLLPPEEETFYDNKVIKVPSGKSVRVVGTCRYEANDGTEKTVPIVKIMDK